MNKNQGSADRSFSSGKPLIFIDTDKETEKEFFLNDYGGNHEHVR